MSFFLILNLRNLLYVIKKESRCRLSFFVFLIIRLSENEEVHHHDGTQADAVPAENLEVVGLDVVHQEADGKNRYDKGDDHTDDQKNNIA